MNIFERYVSKVVIPQLTLMMLEGQIQSSSQNTRVSLTKEKRQIHVMDLISKQVIISKLVHVGESALGRVRFFFFFFFFSLTIDC